MNVGGLVTKKYIILGLAGVALVVIALSLSWGSGGGDAIAFYGTATHGYTVMAHCDLYPNYYPSTTATGENWYILRIAEDKRGWYDLCDGCQNIEGGYWDGQNGMRRDFCVEPEPGSTHECPCNK
jgi:hypothetical protein